MPREKTGGSLEDHEGYSGVEESELSFERAKALGEFDVPGNDGEGLWRERKSESRGESGSATQQGKLRGSVEKNFIDESLFHRADQFFANLIESLEGVDRVFIDIELKTIEDKIDEKKYDEDLLLSARTTMEILLALKGRSEKGRKDLLSIECKRNMMTVLDVANRYTAWGDDRMERLVEDLSRAVALLAESKFPEAYHLQMEAHANDPKRKAELEEAKRHAQSLRLD